MELKSTGRTFCLPGKLAAGKPAPEEEWEGRLTGSAGSCRAFKAHLRFRVRFGADVLVGNGRGLDFPYGPEDKGFELEGSVDREGVFVHLQSSASFLRGIPFICSGDISPQKNKMSGKFDLACFRPDTCACGGGSGVLSFARFSDFSTPHNTLMQEVELTMVAFAHPPIDTLNGLVTDRVPITSETVLCAYQHGVFPWGSDPLSGMVRWHHPPHRGVLPLPCPTISRTDRAFIAAARVDPGLQVTIDEDFDGVILACAAMPRHRALASTQSERETKSRIPERNWITPDFIAAYRELHRLGIAHSVEVRREGRLVAGLYGVDVDGVFSGESMFHVESDVAKLAFWALIEHLQAIGRAFIDTQVAVGLARKWGAQLIPRTEFELLRERAGLSFKPFGN
jgi:leucyl/phenylalanyl-tRNA--protein transferase